MKGLSRSSSVKAGESPAFFASLIRLICPFPGRWNLRGRLAGTTIAVPKFGRPTPRARPVSSPTVREGVGEGKSKKAKGKRETRGERLPSSLLPFAFLLSCALPDGRAAVLKRSCLFARVLRKKGD